MSYLNGGFLSLASSTIGDGAQAGGLTISGGATTTGNAYFAGKIGLGTTTPIEKLHLGATTGYNTIRIDSGTVLGQFGVGTASGGAVFFGAKSDHQLNISTDNTNRLIIENDGSINLQSNDLNFNAGGTSGSNYNFTQTADDILQLQRSGGTDNEYAILDLEAPTANPQESTFTTGLPLGGTNREWIDWTLENYNEFDHFGSINIAKRGTGTLVPFTIRFWDRDQGSVAVAGKPIAFFDPSGATAIGSYSSTTGMNANRYSKFIPLQVASSTATTIFAVDTVGGTHQFVVQGSGSVGVGTTSPWAKLSIQNNYGSTLTSLFSIGSSTAADGSTAATFLTVTSSGNVGLGSSSPSRRNRGQLPQRQSHPKTPQPNPPPRNSPQTTYNFTATATPEQAPRPSTKASSSTSSKVSRRSKQ